MSHHEVNYEELITYLKIHTCNNEESSPLDDLFILRQLIAGLKIGDIDEMLSLISELDQDIKNLVTGITSHLPRPNSSK
jgi:hypothetical protein